MKNINLVRQIAWSFHRTTGLEWDDLFQEAVLGYLEALKNYDPKKGKLTTYAWYCINSRLKNYIRLELKYSDPIISIENAGVHKLPAPNHSLLDQISQEGQKVVDIILSCPEEFDGESPKNAKIKAAKKLRDTDVTWVKIWIGIRDLKLAFSD
jgi:RNA polymerase sigma factor (sigma-70 family)